MGSAEHLARRLAALEAKVDALSASGQLGHSSVEGDTLDFYDDADELRAAIGLHADGEVTLRHFNGPTPAAPSASGVTSKLGAVTITWDGKDSSGAVFNGDGLNVYLSQVDGFTPDESTLIGMIPVPGGPLVMATLTVGDTYFVRTAAVSRSGIVGDLSAQVAIVVTGVSGPDIEAGSVTTNELAAGAVTTDKLDATAIDGMVITGALIRTIPTEDSGDHVELGPGTGSSFAESVNELRFHGSLPEETYPARVRGFTNGVDNVLQIGATEYADATDGPLIELQTGSARDLDKILLYVQHANGSIELLSPEIELNAATVTANNDLIVNRGATLGEFSRPIRGVDFGVLQVDTGPAGGANIPHQLGEAPNFVVCQGSSTYQIAVTGTTANDFGVILYDAAGNALNNVQRQVRWVALLS